jgi:hypothetical protein
MTDWQRFPVEAQPVQIERLRAGMGRAYLLQGSSADDLSHEFEEMFLDPGRVYQVAEVNHCGTITPGCP